LTRNVHDSHNPVTKHYTVIWYQSLVQ